MFNKLGVCWSYWYSSYSTVAHRSLVTFTVKTLWIQLSYQHANTHVIDYNNWTKTFFHAGNWIL